MNLRCAEASPSLSRVVAGRRAWEVRVCEVTVVVAVLLVAVTVIEVEATIAVVLVVVEAVKVVAGAALTPLSSNSHGGRVIYSTPPGGPSWYPPCSPCGPCCIPCPLSLLLLPTDWSP